MPSALGVKETQSQDARCLMVMSVSIRGVVVVVVEVLGGENPEMIHFEILSFKTFYRIRYLVSMVGL